jgi:hypothetical protein
LILLHPKRLLDSFDTSYWQLLWIAFVQYVVRILNLFASRELSVLRLPLFEQQRPRYYAEVHLAFLARVHFKLSNLWFCLCHQLIRLFIRLFYQISCLRLAALLSYSPQIGWP